jgi:hypothetical protein
MEGGAKVRVEAPSRSGVPCQLEAFPAELPGGAPSRVEPWTWYVRRRLRGATRRLGRLFGVDGPRRGPGGEAAFVAEPLEVEAGDLVRVRSAGEIQAMLDGSGSYQGCGFGSGMYRHCGQEFRVARVVTRFFDEARFRMLRARNLVILEGVHCDGSSIPDTTGCDRMCFYFWRTEWLEKVPAGDDEDRVQSPVGAAGDGQSVRAEPGKGGGAG